ncbi:MAG: hypothetical protein N3D10_01660 [Candidatus Micrarchaeota archaeon]|nr:hypothetical protein [Candidatus Micrarchaeota archaeon]
MKKELQLEDISEISKEIVELEKKTSLLLEEYASISSKYPKIEIRKIKQETYKIAKNTSKILEEFKEKKSLVEFEKYEKELKKVEGRANALIEQLGDSLIIENESKITGEFEAVINNINRIKRWLDIITLPHVDLKQKKVLWQQLYNSLYVTKQRIKIIEDILKNKSELKKSSLYQSLVLLANKTNEIIQLKDQIENELKERKIYDSARFYTTEIKKFLVKELEGRIYIDKKILKLTSRLTGKIEEYYLDSKVKMALEILFKENPEFLKMINEITEESENSAIVGEFKLSHQTNALRVDFELKHRKIHFDSVVAKPVYLKILI